MTESKIIENAVSRGLKAKAENSFLRLSNYELPFAQIIASKLRCFGYARIDRNGDIVTINF